MLQQHTALSAGPCADRQARRLAGLQRTQRPRRTHIPTSTPLQPNVASDGASCSGRPWGMLPPAALPQGPASAAAPAPRRASKSASVDPVRAEAVSQLLRIEQEGAYSALVSGRVETIDDELEGGSNMEPRASLTPREQRSVKALVANVTRWRRRLDYIIGCMCGKAEDSLEPEMRQVLRIALHELTQGQLQPHAVNTHVELVRALLQKPAAVAFANGVLRAAVRRRAEGTLPDPDTDMAGTSGRNAGRKLAVVHSHPTWLVSRWIKQFGQEEAVRLMEHNNRPPTYYLRVNRSAGQTVASALQQLSRLEEPVQAEAAQHLPEDFIKLTSGLQAVLRAGLVASGALTVQDEATGLVVALLDPQPGDCILDACAAPGGKALFMASRLQGRGMLVAMDVSPRRLRALQNTAQAAALANVLRVGPGDLRQYAQAAAGTAGIAGSAASGRDSSSSSSSSGGGSSSSSSGGSSSHTTTGSGPGGLPLMYDKVLLDAPCSGTGVLAKRADLRWRRTPEQLQQLVALQDELLTAAAALVRPGGLLVYSTCSIEAEENQDRVAEFVGRSGGEFEVERPPVGLLPESVVAREGWMVTLPHVHGVDGAFGVRLRRRGGVTAEDGVAAGAALWYEQP